MQTPRQKQILQSSVPLRRIDINQLPTGSASGCLVDYRGRRLLITVEHATGDHADWAIQLKFERGNGTKLHRIGPMNFLACISHNLAKTKTIDFAYAEVPPNLKAYRQEIKEDGTILSEVPITVFSTDLSAKPDQDDTFGFAGLVKTVVENHPMTTFVADELNVYDGLKYLGMEDETLIFKLPFAHPGHQEFEGCSGAPIINMAGVPIALLTGGNISRNEIYGIALSRYRTPLDILVDQTP